MKTAFLDPKPEKPMYAELTVSTTPVSLADATPAMPEGTARAYIACEDGAVRWLADGSVPSATKGHPIAANDSVSFTNRDYTDLLKAIKFIRVTVDAKLTITYDP